MPALVDLDQYLDANKWRVAYDAALAEAQRVAAIIPLVHVSGNESRLPFERLIFDPPHEIPTSADLVYYSDKARRAEGLLGLAHSCYFYAGRAHPQYGSVALAFAADSETGRDGAATPFDSGALVHPDPRKRLQLVLDGGDGDANRAAFAQASQVSLPDWRHQFARFLAAYFQDARSYWLNGPARADPEEVFILNNEWVAWTFEIRFNIGPSIHGRLAWCADSFVMSRLRRCFAAEPLPVPGVPPTPLQRWFQAGPGPIAPAGSPHFHLDIETWIRRYLDLEPA